MASTIAHSSNTKIHRLKLEHVWATIVLAGILAFVNTHPIRPHDFWWHMAVGREIVETREIPKVDTYSYTMHGTPYASYRMFWLPEIALYLIYTFGGPALIVAVNSFLITSTYLLQLWLMYGLAHSWRGAAFVTLFAASLGFNDWNVRPQVIAFPIAALFLLTIKTYHRHRRPGRLIVFPLGMIIWVNSHGTFPIGLFLIATWLADETWTLLRHQRRTKKSETATQLWAPALALATSVTACLLNPRGIGLVHYITQIAGNSAIQSLVTEWAAPSFSTLGGQIFLGMLILSIGLLILSHKPPTLFEAITFLAMTVLGLTTLRGSIWFGLIAAPTLASRLPELRRQATLRIRGWRQAPTRESPLLNAMLSALAIAASVVTLPWFKPFLQLPPAKAGLISQETPVAATRTLMRHNLPGPLFHDMSFGSYLIWAAQSEYQVFIDPRIELYPEAIWMDYLRLSAADQGWEQTLNHYGAQTLMLSPSTQAQLIQAARRSSEWIERYADKATVILTRYDQ